MPCGAQQQRTGGALMAETSQTGGEAAIIAALAPLAAGYPGAFGLTDDCAAISPTPGHDLVVKTDPIAEGVHFLAGDAPEDIGWKALAVNVSDLAAKAAVPRAYLLALSFPVAPRRAWIERLAKGLAEAQAAFGMHLVGGDTDRRPGPITLSVTVFGEVATGRMVRRGTARPGDLLYVSGTLGDAALGLTVRQDPTAAARWGLSAADADAVRARALRPLPRLALRQALLDHAHAAMDLSDGLAKDLGRMCRASGVGAWVRLDRLPLSEAGKRAVAADARAWQAIAATGDDYEVLVAVPRANAAVFEAKANADGAASAPAFGVACIGEVTGGDAVDLIDAAGQPVAFAQTGWDHF